jgi:hypothetical protein
MAAKRRVVLMAERRRSRPTRSSTHLYGTDSLHTAGSDRCCTAMQSDLFFLVVSCTIIDVVSIHTSTLGLPLKASRGLRLVVSLQGW